MLWVFQKASDQAAECLRQVAETEARAEMTDDANSKAEYRRIGDPWRTLASSYELLWPKGASVGRRKARMAGESTTAERAERLASLVTLSYEPMLAWRLGGPIEFWNAGAERLYGFASDEAIGRSSHSLLQTKFPIELAEVMSRLRNDGNWSGELRHVCKDGREVIVDSRQQLLADGTVLEVNRDVTALRENEEQLRWRRQLSTPATTRS